MNINTTIQFNNTKYGNLLNGLRAVDNGLAKTNFISEIFSFLSAEDLINLSQCKPFKKLVTNFYQNRPKTFNDIAKNNVEEILSLLDLRHLTIVKKVSRGLRELVKTNIEKKALAKTSLTELIKQGAPLSLKKAIIEETEPKHLYFILSDALNHRATPDVVQIILDREEFQPGVSHLHCAIKQNSDPIIISMLVQSGVNPRMTLRYAIFKHCSPKVVQAVVDVGGNEGESDPIRLALRSKASLEVFKIIIQTPQAKSELQEEYSDILPRALQEGASDEVIELLVENGAKVDEDENDSPIIAPLLKSKASATKIKAFIKAGAKLEGFSSGYKALCAACYHGVSPDAIQAIIHGDVNINAHRDRYLNAAKNYVLKYKKDWPNAEEVMKTLESALNKEARSTAA